MSSSEVVTTTASVEVPAVVPRPVGRAAELALLGPRRAVLALAWPGILENLVAAGGTTVVFALAGRLGAEALAAYGASLQLLFLLFPVWMSLSIGAIALVSRRMGAGLAEEAALYARQALLLGLAIALAAGIAFIGFAEQLVLLLGAEPAVARAAGPYLRIAGGGSVAGTLLFIGLAALRGAGDMRTPLALMALSNGSILVLGYLLLGPLGLAGLAIAVVTGNSLALLVTYLLLARGRGGLRLGRGRWRLDLQATRTLLRVSLPASGEQVLWSVGLLLLSMVAIRLGTAPFAAYNLILQVETVSIFPCFGMLVATSTLVGQALGMEDVRRGERGSFAAWQTALVWTTATGIAFVLFAEPIVRIFTTDEAVVAAAVPALRLLGLLQPVHAFSFVFAGSLRGAGDTRFLFRLTLVEWLAVRPALVWLFVVTVGWGLVGLVALFFVDNVFRATAITLRFRSRAWARLRY